jgi:chemotaxis protein histidine kinase CheA
LNGEIESKPGKGIGTRFTLKVPLTLIISQALFVRVRQADLCLPAGVCGGDPPHLRSSEIEEVGGKLSPRSAMC